MIHIPLTRRCNHMCNFIQAVMVTYWLMGSQSNSLINQLLSYTYLWTTTCVCSWYVYWFLFSYKRMKIVTQLHSPLKLSVASQSTYVIRNFIGKFIFWANALQKELSNAAISWVPGAYDSPVTQCRTTAEQALYLRHGFSPSLLFSSRPHPLSWIHLLLGECRALRGEHELHV